MDGHFVPNITMGPPVLESVHKTVENVFMDCHMMVSEPHKVSTPCHVSFLPQATQADEKRGNEVVG